MKIQRLHLTLLAWTLSCIALNIYVRTSIASLPPRLAVHFDALNRPNGWMTGAQASTCIIGLSLGISLLLFFLGYLSRWIPSKRINIPNRDYWLTPQHRDETNTYLFEFFVRTATTLILFCIGLQYLLVEANHHSPPTFSTSHLIVMVTLLTLINLAFGLLMSRHFSHPPKS